MEKKMKMVKMKIKNKKGMEKINLDLKKLNK